MLKVARENCQLAHIGKLNRISLDLSAKNPKDRRVWYDIFQFLRANNYQLILLYPKKLF
jgi:hypothetical protein